MPHKAMPLAAVVLAERGLELPDLVCGGSRWAPFRGPRAVSSMTAWQRSPRRCHHIKGTLSAKDSEEPLIPPSPTDRSLLSLLVSECHNLLDVISDFDETCAKGLFCLRSTRAKMYAAVTQFVPQGDVVPESCSPSPLQCRPSRPRPMPSIPATPLFPPLPHLDPRPPYERPPCPNKG